MYNIYIYWIHISISYIYVYILLYIYIIYIYYTNIYICLLGSSFLLTHDDIDIGEAAADVSPFATPQDQVLLVPCGK